MAMIVSMDMITSTVSYTTNNKLSYIYISKIFKKDNLYLARWKKTKFLFHLLSG